jgi:CheY-like chemotaxis protein
MAAHDSVNILMVDDQPAKLLSYEVMLEELGENLIKANSAKEALEHLLKTDVAVVLMDVSMPEFDGFELASMIRQHPRFQRTAIIFISAVHLTDLDRLKAYERGAVDYISVPVIPDLLRAKVKADFCVSPERGRKTQRHIRRDTGLAIEDAGERCPGHLQVFCGGRYVHAAQKLPEQFAWVRRVVHAHIDSPNGNPGSRRGSHSSLRTRRSNANCHSPSLTNDP